MGSCVATPQTSVASPQQQQQTHSAQPEPKSPEQQRARAPSLTPRTHNFVSVVTHEEPHSSKLLLSPNVLVLRSPPENSASKRRLTLLLTSPVKDQSQTPLDGSSAAQQQRGENNAVELIRFPELLLDPSAADTPLCTSAKIARDASDNAHTPEHPVSSALKSPINGKLNNSTSSRRVSFLDTVTVVNAVDAKAMPQQQQQQQDSIGLTASGVSDLLLCDSSNKIAVAGAGLSPQLQAMTAAASMMAGHTPPARRIEPSPDHSVNSAAAMRKVLSPGSGSFEGS